MRFDPQVLAEDTALLTRLEEERNALSRELTDATVGATDKPRSEPEQANWDAKVDLLDIKDRDIRDLRDKITRMEAHRQQTRNDFRRMDAHGRALATLVAGLDAPRLPGGIGMTPSEMIGFEIGMDDASRASAEQAVALMGYRGVRVGKGIRMTLDSDDTGAGARQTDTLPRIVRAMKYSGGVAPFAQHYDTPNVDIVKVPRSDDTDQDGIVITDQSASIGEQDPATIGSATFDAFVGSSKRMPVNRQMMMLGLGNQVEMAINGDGRRRISRAWENQFMNGTGIGNPANPAGVATTATAGVTAAAQDAITYDEIVDLVQTLDPAYREGTEDTEYGDVPAEMNGRVGFVIPDSAIGILRKLKGNGIPLWAPGILGQGAMVGGVPGTILQYPYAVSGKMPAVAAGTVAMLFGNFAYYMIRNAMVVEVFVLMDSTTMDTNSVQIIILTYRDAAPIGKQAGAGRETACEAWVKLTMKA